MSKKKILNGKSNKTDLQYDTKEVLIPIIILLIFLIFILISIVNFISSITYKPQTDYGNELYWERQYLEVEKNKVGIKFDTIFTSEEEYEKLKASCMEFIENDDKENIDAHIDVDTLVDEKLYIDTELKELDKIEDSDLDIDIALKQTENAAGEDFSETGPIYLNNMLMMRYINEDGYLKVITAIFKENSEDIEISKQDKLLDTIKDIRPTDNNEVETKVEESNNLDKRISEKEYLNNITDTLIDMLTATTNEEIQLAESKAINYFTLEGKQTVFGNRDRIQLENSDIKAIYAVAGKSNLGKLTKDRIYTQLSIRIHDKESGNINEDMVYIVLKLNSNLRVFDIDIL